MSSLLQALGAEYAEEMVKAYTSEQENESLDFDQLLGLAYQRDQEAAGNLEMDAVGSEAEDG